MVWEGQREEKTAGVADELYRPTAREFLLLTEDVKAIKRALLGDEFSRQGMVARLDGLEGKVAANGLVIQRVKWLILGAMIAGAALGVGVNDLLVTLLAG